MTPSSITWSALPVIRDRVNRHGLTGDTTVISTNSGTLDIELVVQSVYADTYVKTTTYNIHVDTPEDLAVAPYYLLRFDVVGFTQTEYNYRWTASI